MKKYFVIIMLLVALTIPVQAMAAEIPADGEYLIKVSLSGGSGRAQVESPAVLTITDGAMTATIIWSSPHYTYMQLGDTKYDPIGSEGNSAFRIPVASLDTALAVRAETIAMSAPHVIEYELYFDSNSLTEPGANNKIFLTIIIVFVIVLIAILLFVRSCSQKRQK